MLLLRLGAICLVLMAGLVPASAQMAHLMGVTPEGLAARAALNIDYSGVQELWDSLVDPAQQAANAAKVCSTTNARLFRNGLRLFVHNWCGVDQRLLSSTSPSPAQNDFIATIDATPCSPDYGKVVNIADTPFQGTQPHHVGVDKSGKWLGAGGLVSLLGATPTPDIFMFNLSPDVTPARSRGPAKPLYSHGITATRGACTDEFLPDQSQAGFFVTNMCSRQGTAGGGGILTIAGSDMKTVREFTGGLSASKPADLLNRFASHGIDVDYGAKRIVTCDFVDVVSTLSSNNPTPGIQLMTSARIWDLTTKTIIKTIDLAGKSNGLMDVRHNGVQGSGIFWTTNGLGQWIRINALTGSIKERVFCLDGLNGNCNAVPGTCIMSNVWVNTAKGASARRMLITTFTLSQVRLLDVSDPDNLIELDRWQMPASSGGHVVKYHEATRTAAISTYFVDQLGTILADQGDQRVTLLNINFATDKIEPIRAVDFTDAVAAKGSSNCHGLAYGRAQLVQSANIGTYLAPVPL